ncbi:MAG: hypothetical protein MJZ94_05280 [Bacteroidales bacterium]|nr:hypothetical protein [Bacteroidales bacterium]
MPLTAICSLTATKIGDFVGFAKRLLEKTNNDSLPDARMKETNLEQI